ncbi:MAG: hypothetical protein C4576_06725 [Desulfobacteraceae bacterium]|nr:MAG: hypothetical protein C4576_06725 [Desulfobacteraceae bacterium]
MVFQKVSKCYLPLLAVLALDAIVLITVVALRNAHPPGHDELNALETGLRMLGSRGNPETFIHGSFFYDLMALLHGVTYLIAGLTSHGWSVSDYLGTYLEYRETFLLAGRVVVLGFAFLLIGVVYRLAHVLYGERAGLLAIIILSFGPLLPLTGTALKEDLPASAFAVSSVLVLCDSAIRVRPSVRWGLAGVLCGAGVATKYTIVLLTILPVVLAFGLGILTNWRLVIAYATCTMATFLLFEPYLVLDFTRAQESFWTITGVHFASGTLRPVASLYIQSYFPLGLGILLALVTVVAAARIVLYEGDVRLKAIVVSCIVTAAVLMSSTSGMLRYVITLGPLISVFVAGEVMRWNARWFSNGFAVVAVAILLTWPANLIAVKLIALLARPDTRVVAQEWIEAHVPTGSRVLLEGTISGEPSYAPAIVPSAQWFQARQDHARMAGTSGRLLEAAAVRAATSSRPRYDILNTAVEGVSALEKVDYVVLSDYHALPMEFCRDVRRGDPHIERELSSRATAIHLLEKDFVQVFSIEPVPDLRFDWFDTPDFLRLWEASFSNYEKWMVGPVITVYRRAVTA